MAKLILFTGNQRKIAEAEETFDEFGIKFTTMTADIDEIQHHNPTEIAKAKAKTAYEIAKKPLVINDSSWSIPALGGFPGGYMKEVNQWFKADDWQNLMRDKEDKSIIIHERTVYYDGKEMKIFEFPQTGTFVDAPRGRWHEDMETMVSLYDGKTIAENHDAEKVGEKIKHSGHWRTFAKWYVDNVSRTKNGTN
jgi:non-canonical purine NTP pyrophosphatase (RdgB/HAM1 family)